MGKTKKKKTGGSADGHKLVTKNRQAFRNFFITDRFEAGMVLLGSEVKSLRGNRVSLGDAYGEIRKGEIFLLNCHISPYTHASHFNHEPLRERKLLMGKKEILKLSVKLHERGFTLVPLAIYFKEGWAKVELGLGKGKKLHDKRDAVKDRDIKRDMAQEAKG